MSIYTHTNIYVYTHTHTHIFGCVEHQKAKSQFKQRLDEISAAKQDQLPQLIWLGSKLKLCSLGQGMITVFMELTTGNMWLCWFSQQMPGRSIRMGQKYSMALFLCVTWKKIPAHGSWIHSHQCSSEAEGCSPALTWQQEPSRSSLLSWAPPQVGAEQKFGHWAEFWPLPRSESLPRLGWEPEAGSTLKFCMRPCNNSTVQHSVQFRIIQRADCSYNTNREGQEWHRKKLLFFIFFMHTNELF